MDWHGLAVKPLTETEQQLQSKILLALGQRRDLKIWRSNAGDSLGFNGGVIKGLPAGHPDLSGMLRGGAWYGLEVKRPGQKPSESQVKFAAMCKQMSAHYAVVHSVDEASAAVDVWLGLAVAS